MRDARDRLDVPADVHRGLGLLLARLRHLLDALEHLARVLDDRVERAAGLVHELAAAREVRPTPGPSARRPPAPPPRSRGSPGDRLRGRRRLSARSRISSATTAKVRPCLPARAASIAALRARRLVWSASCSITRVIFVISWLLWPSAATVCADAADGGDDRVHAGEGVADDAAALLCVLPRALRHLGDDADVARVLGDRGRHLLRRAGDLRRLLDLLRGAGGHLLGAGADVPARRDRRASRCRAPARPCVRMFATATLKPCRSWPISSSLVASSSTERSPSEKRLIAPSISRTLPARYCCALRSFSADFGELRVHPLEAAATLGARRGRRTRSRRRSRRA